MQPLIKRIIVLCCATALILLPLGSAALGESNHANDDLSAEKMAVDVAIIRPLGVVASAAGCLIYIVSLPFSIPGGNAGKVWETTVVEPVKFTFDRPVGEF